MCVCVCVCVCVSVCLSVCLFVCLCSGAQETDKYLHSTTDVCVRMFVCVSYVCLKETNCIFHSFGPQCMTRTV